MTTLPGICLIFLTAAQAEVLRPKPTIHHSFDFEKAIDGWQACGKGIARAQQETTYRASQGALQLSWDANEPNDGWVERSVNITLSPDTWISLFYRADGPRCSSFAIRLLTPDGTAFTCPGFSAPDSPWRHILIRISFEWWAREFCFSGPKGAAPPPGTPIARLQIGASPLKGTDPGPRSLYLDDVVLFDAFGADEIRALFNPRGVVRPQHPCPIAFTFPKDLKHPYLISSPEALRKQAAAFKADPEGGQVRAAIETNYANSIGLWIAQFLGKLKAPAEVQTPQDAEKAFREKDTEEGFDEILNPEPPPPTELTEKDWQEFFEKPFLPQPSDPRYLEERANICGRCALALPFDPLRPTWHQCPRCRQRYVGPAYDNVWTIQMQRRDAGTAYSAAYAYRVSGNKRWGRVAKKIALGYCDALESDRRFQIGTNGASGFSLQPSALIPMLDLLADTDALSREEQERIRDNFVVRSIRAGTLFDPTPPGPPPAPQREFHYSRRLVDNQIGHALKEMMWIGLAAQNEDYIRNILDYYDEALYNGLNEEGVWWEKSIDYQLYFRKGLIMLGGLAERAGLHIYTHTASNGNCFRRIYDAELKIVLPDNQLPSLNDGGYVGFCWAEAYQFYGDKKYHRAGDDLVPLPSGNLPVTGWCALRSDAPRAEDQTYVMLDYGTGSGAHAHPDTMQIILYARRKYVSPDLGVASYHASGYWTWYKNPKSHSTMTPLPTAGKTLYFEHSPRLKIIDVETPRDAPLRHRRTVAILRDQYVLDLFRADSDQEQSYTWRYHNIGTLETRQETLANGLRWHQAYWDLRDNQALRLSLLARPETSFAAQTGLGFRPTETLFYVAAQRKSKCFLAPSVIEPFIDITADPRKVKLEDQVKAVQIGTEKPAPGVDGPLAEGEDPLEEHIQDEEAGPKRPGAPAPLPYQIAGQRKLAALPISTGEGQAAFSVASEDGAEDFCLCPYDMERPWDVNGVQLSGEIALVLTDRGKPVDLLLLRGRSLSAKGWYVESSAPGAAHLYAVPEGCRIHIVPSVASQWTVRLEGSRLDGLIRIAADGSQQPANARIANDSVQWEVTEESDYLLKVAPSP